MRPVGLSLLVLLLTTIVPAAALGGGLVDSLGKATDPPDDKDRPEGEGQGKPATPDAPWKPPEKPAPAPTTDIDGKIAGLRRRIQEMEKVKAEDIEPVDGLGEAQRRVGRLRDAVEKGRQDLAGVDQAETRRLAERVREFEQKWKGQAEAIERGQIPPGLDPMTWAGRCDDYFTEKADLEADAAGAARRLRTEQDRRLAPLAHALEDAEQHVEQMRRAYSGLSDGQKQFFGRMLAWKLHKAHLLAAKQALADLERLRQDRLAQARKAEDPIEAEIIEKTGYLLADALARLVLRELSLADADRVPDRIDKGIPLPDWMKHREAEARLQAKCEYVAEQLELTQKALRNLQRDLEDEDAAEVARLQRSKAPPAAVREKQRELQESRVHRLNERREELLRQKAHWNKALEEASAELQKTAPRPAPPAKP